MQKFFTDKSKLFECNIMVDGANLNETKARLILEFPNKRNLLFHGKIDKSGKCQIVVPALKEMEECEGNALLEVIAEKTHFESWQDKFKLETNKKVQVEVYEEPEKEVITEEVKAQVEVVVEIEEEISPNYKKFKDYITENKINLDTTIKSKKAFFGLLREYKTETNATKEEIISVVEDLQKEIKLLKS